MLTGGLGVWLHEGAAGLRFRFAPAPPPRVDAAAAAAADAALAASALGHDPRARAALSDAALLAALAAAAADGAAGGAPRAGFLRRARAAARAAGVPARAPPPALVPTLRVAPRAALVRALRAASAWRDTPAGRVAANWTYAPPPAARFALRVATFAGARAAAALPLALLREAPALRVRDAAGGAAFAGTLARGAAAAAPGCAPLGAVEGEAVALCGGAGVLAPPRLASAADADGDARLGGGAVTWADGALLLELPAGAEGQWEFVAAATE
jgi:hypothetical protein